MTGQGLLPAPAPRPHAEQFSLGQSQTSPRRSCDGLPEGSRREDRGCMESDVVDAEAVVASALLTMRELESNTGSNDRVLQIAANAQGHCRRESVEDDQSTRRSDSAATAATASTAAGLFREAVSAQRNALNVGQGSAPGPRPNSGHSLASRPNSFSGKKRKPGANDEDAPTGSTPAIQFCAGDVRGDGTGVTASEAAALQLQQQLTAVAAVEALVWRQGAASAGGGVGVGAQSLSVGRVSSEPIINGGQRLPGALLARLGLASLGGAGGDVAAMERLRAMVLGASANGAEPAPSAKRPHMLSRQSSAAAATATTALSFSAEDLHSHQHQQQHLGASAAAAAAALAAAAAAAATSERTSSGRPDWAQAAPGPSAAVKVERSAQVPAEVGPAAAGGSGSAELPSGGDAATHGPGPSAGAAAAAVTARATGGGGSASGPVRPGTRCAQGDRRRTPPSPLGHHSDTGSDSGSPSARTPYLPGGKAHGSEHQPPQHIARGGGGGGTSAADADAAGGGADVDEPTAPSAPLRTSSVISLLHMLAIRQQQQQQRQLPHGRGAAGLPSGRSVSDPAEAAAGAEAALGGPGAEQQHSRGLRELERVQQDTMADPRVGLNHEHLAAAAAALAAGGFHPDMDAAAVAAAAAAATAQNGGGAGAYGNGKVADLHSRGGGPAAQHRQLSMSREHTYIGGAPAVDMMQVDPSSPPPPPPAVRTVSGLSEVPGYLHPAAVAAGAAAAAAVVSERTAMDTDTPLPHTSSAASASSDQRIHASLAAIERKLLLQEERLVYELKQVRLMQKLLHVQQMKQMVREAMRGRDRDAAAAAAVAAAEAAGGGTDGFFGAGAPFPPAAAAAAGSAAEGADVGLSRFSGLPPHILVAATRSAMAAAAAGGGGGGSLMRELSGTVDVLRSNSTAAAAAAVAGGGGGAAEHHAGPADQAHPPLHHRSAQGRQRHSAEGRRDADGSAAEDGWSTLGADGGGRLLSYIAALFSSKGAAAASLAPPPPPSRRDGAMGTATVLAAAAAEALGISEQDGAGLLDGRGAPSRHRAREAVSDGVGAGYRNGIVPPLPQGSHAAYDDGASALGGVAESLAGGGVGCAMTEDEQALLQRRLIEALLRQQQQQQIQLQSPGGLADGCGGTVA